MSVNIPPRGSRGTRLPDVPGPMKWLGLRAFELFTKLKRTPLAYLTTIGAKSGLERTVPLRVFDDGPGRWLVVASLAGSAKNPAWLHNLAAHPDCVRLRVGNAQVAVRPETLSGEERTVAWDRIVAEERSFAGYQANTDRVIPVVRLTRSSTD